MSPAVLAFVHNPIVQGALTGALAAAATDFHAFKTWTSFHDAATYDWWVAVFRWIQGAFVGLLAAAGISAF